MIASMTGYGHATSQKAGYKVSVELRTVNHRFFEWFCKMPRPLIYFEEEVKKTVRQSVHRGKVEVFITVDGEGLHQRALHVDWSLLEQYRQVAKKIGQVLETEARFDVHSLLVDEQLVSMQEETAVNETVTDLVIETLREAINQLCKMRNHEGELLANDLKKRLTTLLAFNEQIKTLAPNVANDYRDRLKQRIEEYVQGLDHTFDEWRLLAEVAIFAEKADISEELTRLDAHIKQFFAILAAGGIVGRKLDFLVQEMNREANTIGSKANHLDIRQIVVEVKSEIEKLKEQVQNIE
ncbi:YicC/YloC family endoribonuclease [Halalkalibacterium ligniniphilum]|uniref:YicC/YloC family endoribonuclease n=1 Tax=Halalkalibacterium ligniniphilum TaxID=1134413 RepID=UPI00037A0354|nr:YicC/YloC family endoribonuclease [Halalkalibacterium ligniniphilum]